MSASARPLSAPVVRVPAAAVSLLDGVILLALACAVRLVWLDRASLWVDEQFSVYWSQLDLRFILGPGAHLETNPPGYYLLLHGWIEAAGASAFAVRLPSLLFSALTVLVAYAIGRALFDRPTAWLAALFVAIDPASITFAQEARPYALTALLDALALLALAGVALAAPAGRRSWPWIALFALALIGAFLAHYTSLLFIAACFTVIALDVLTTRPFPVRRALLWIAVALAIGAAIAVPLAIAMSLTDSGNIAWIYPLSLGAVRVFFMDILLYPEVPYTPLWVGGCAVLLLILLTALPRLRLDRAQFGVLVIVPVVFCALLIVATVFRPMLLARVGVWLVLPLCLLLARAAVVQPTRWRRVAAAALTAFVLLSALGHYLLRFEKEDWRAAAGVVAGEKSCGGPILFGAANGLGLLYYEPSLRGRPVYAVLNSPREQQTAEFELTRRVMSPGTLDAASVGAFAAAHPHTVMVMRAIFMDAAPASLRALADNAPFRATVAGKLMVSCL